MQGAGDARGAGEVGDRPGDILTLVTDADSPLPRLAILDGNGIIHRAWHAFKEPLTVRKTGEVVTAVYGMTNTLLKMIDDLHPTYVVMAMDLGRPRRADHMETYKANRAATDTDLRSQFERCRQIVKAFNIPIYEAEGWEADDVLGTLADQARDKGVEIFLVSLDSDIAQLVDPDVKLFMYRLYQRDTVIYDEAGVETRYGVRPPQIADLKALKGDSSDNIPGIPGVGEKTAAKLIQQFGSVEALYENLSLVQPAKLQAPLQQYEEQVRLSKRIATIERDAPVQLDLEASRLRRYDRDAVATLLRDLEMRSLVDRLPEPELGGESPVEGKQLRLGEESPPPTAIESYETVLAEADLRRMVAEVRSAGQFAFDAEGSAWHPLWGTTVGISIATPSRHAWYIPLGHSHADDGMQLPLQTVMDAVRPLFIDPSLHKTAHDAKHDMEVLANDGVWTEGVDFDTYIAAFVLGSGRGDMVSEAEGTGTRGASNLTLEALAHDRLRLDIDPLAKLTGTGVKKISPADVSLQPAAQLMAEHAGTAILVRDALEKELREQQLYDLFRDIEMPLVPVLTRMELTGIALDGGELREMAVELGEELRQVEARIYDAVGHEFNIGSPQQLGQILFFELNLPKPRKTKTGYTTDAATLEGLRGAHPAIDLILEHRQLGKIKSTYIDALPGLVNPKTGRVHTTYNQTGAATGRLSSNNPNLQNIPVRTDLGKRVRRAFIARDVEPDPHLLAADYSQIELRIMAHYAQDPGLIEAFRNDEDIHTTTAAEVMGVPRDQVTPDMRRLAKVVNFGLIYGLSEYGLATRTELSREEAGAFIRTYFAKFPAVQDYIRRSLEETRRRGYAETLAGRRRYLPEIRSPNIQVRQAAERMAMNMPIQGLAADIIKIAMIRIQAELDRRQLRSRMLLQVHDELIFEAPSAELDELRGVVTELMPSAMELTVPLKVEVKVGRNWGEMAYTPA